ASVLCLLSLSSLFVFSLVFDRLAPTVIPTPSLHDALPICRQLDLNPNQRGFVNGVPGCHVNASLVRACLLKAKTTQTNLTVVFRSEEHTSELQSRFDLVCRLLLDTTDRQSPFIT